VAQILASNTSLRTDLVAQIKASNTSLRTDLVAQIAASRPTMTTYYNKTIPNNNVYIDDVLVYLDGTLTSGIGWASQPRAETEIFGDTSNRTRIWYNMSRVMYYRVVANLAQGSNTSATLRPQYVYQQNQVFRNFTTDTSDALNINKTYIKQVIKTNWIAKPSGMNNDTLIRLVGINGNGTASSNPAFYRISFQFMLNGSVS
jgi:hypothetical protein